MVDPDIDAPLSGTERDAILSQIHAERPPDIASALHPNVATDYTPAFTPAMQAEHDRIASGVEKIPEGQGIDMDRYNNIDAPEETTAASEEERLRLLQQWHSALQKANANSTYISGRLTHLSLLETYGKNAWLMGNDQLEQLLRGLELDYAEAKKTLETTEEERKTRQEGVYSEMKMLDESWKTAVRGLIEVQIATEELKQEVLRKKTEAASAE